MLRSVPILRPAAGTLEIAAKPFGTSSSSCAVALQKQPASVLYQQSPQGKQVMQVVTCSWHHVRAISRQEPGKGTRPKEGRERERERERERGGGEGGDETLNLRNKKKPKQLERPS